MLEIGATQGQRVSDLMGATGFDDVAITKDLGAHDRVAVGRLGATV